MCPYLTNASHPGQPSTRSFQAPHFIIKYRRWPLRETANCFHYRLITGESSPHSSANQKVVTLLGGARREAAMSASLSEGLRRRGRGPARSSPWQPQYSNNYPRLSRAYGNEAIPSAMGCLLAHLPTFEPDFIIFSKLQIRVITSTLLREYWFRNKLLAKCK